MRKVVLFLHMSLDGFVQGTNDWDIGWVAYNEELEKYAKEVTSTADTILWGRTTYHGMQQYWPTIPANPASSPHEIEHARWLDNTLKVVFSRTLDQVEWTNTKLVKSDIAEEIAALKQQPGRDILILGSPRLAHLFMELGLIDEYRLTVSPVVLGNGLPLFRNVADRINLKLLQSQTFQSGALGLHYQQIRS